MVEFTFQQQSVLDFLGAFLTMTAGFILGFIVADNRKRLENE